MINKDWHLSHKMPQNPTLKERVEWHVEHAKVCNCRKMPDSIKELIKTYKNSL